LGAALTSLAQLEAVAVAVQFQDVDMMVNERQLSGVPYHRLDDASWREAADVE
jgi:hypothetical protein